MSLLIKNARLLDPETGLDETGYIKVERNTISALEIGTTNERADEVIDAQGLCLAPGLVDLRVKTGEPGAEHRETIATASRAAVAGGVTSMVVMPDTHPVIDDVALVQFISNRGNETALNHIYPAGGITRDLSGKSMAEIGLMQDAGAVFFTNGDKAVSDAATLRRLWSYAASRNAIVSSRPNEESLVGSGIMNAGPFADRLGLKGMPAIAEQTGLARDLLLAQDTGVHLIIDQITLGASLRQISAARSQRTKLSTTVAAHHLFFNELDVGNYLTYCKTDPPFRREDDRQSLIEAVASGEIDAVVSAHDPQPPEEKRLPFAEASFGATGLETLLSTVLGLVQDGRMSLLRGLSVLTSGPANILGLPCGRLSIGAPADLILFDPNKPWKCTRAGLRSRSTNSPYDGRLLVGLVHQTYVAGRKVFERNI